VSGDNPRLLELRRRVQADPASIAFAQLAEECRRDGANDEAVGICRAGLAFHPDYLSARVTLGRALTELGKLDEAHAELNTVLTQAPDNLAANRAMAEIQQQQGKMQEALKYYKKALQLAQYDPDLETAVERIEHVVSPPPPPEKNEAAPVTIEDLFDFDTLLAQLGGRTQPKPEIPVPAMPLTPIVSPLADVQLPADDNDPFAVLEKQLRENEDQVRPHPAPRPVEDAATLEQRQRDQRVMAALEDWLMAIVADRKSSKSA
jgi:tetratricopeptide (TPR) repeat protein